MIHMLGGKKNHRAKVSNIFRQVNKELKLQLFCQDDLYCAATLKNTMMMHQHSAYTGSWVNTFEGSLESV